MRETVSLFQSLAPHGEGTLAGQAEPAAAMSALAPGAVLNGRYVVEAVLGHGGMGVVYAANDTLKNRVVALKTIRGRLIQMNRLSLFKAEFKAMTELRHPNVAQVYDFESLHGSEDHFFTMELAEGQTAVDATEGAPIAQIVDVLVSICRALSYIHDHRIIHFDLKPANVIVCSDGAVKVLDFGLVGAHARVKARGMVGTPSYMAPELISGADVDHRADLYSLGIMTYQLLCRRLPHEATDLLELHAMHCLDPVEFSTKEEARIPWWLRDVVHKLCAKEPALRFPTAGAVIDAINRGGGTHYELATRETRESYILSSRFTGRSEELNALVEAALNRAQGRGEHAPCWFVRGQGGMGKSRLMREARHALQLARLTFVGASFYESDVSEFGAIAEALRHLLALAASVNGEQLIQEYGPELVKILPSLTRDHQITPSAALPSARDEQVRLHEALSAFIVSLSELVPFVLCLDDMQWASEAAVGAVDYLLRRIGSAQDLGQRVRMTLFAGYRGDESAGRPIEKLVEEAGSTTAVSVIELRPLDTQQVSIVLRSMLGIDEIPEGFVERVRVETAGNPFFIEEVMRALVENGAVYLQNGAWAAADEVDKLDIPAGIAAVFQRRVALLEPLEREVLEALSVSAAPTSIDVLRTLFPSDEVALHGAISELERRQMLGLASEGHYAIAHDRMRETVYQTLEAKRRIELHNAFARVLEKDESSADRLERLAYHLAHAGELDRAVRAGIEAAERADAARQFTHALNLYLQAADWLAALADDRDRHIEVLLNACRLAEFVTQRERYDALVTRLMQLVEQGCPETLRVRAYMARSAQQMQAGEFAGAQHTLDLALDGARVLKATELERDVVRSLGFLAWSRGEARASVEYNERALAIDKRLGDGPGYVVDLGHLATALRNLGELERALALAQEALQRGRELGDGRLQSQTMAIVAALHVDRGEFEEKLRVWLALEDAVVDLPAQRAILWASVASALWRLGRAEESISAYERAVEVTRRIQFLPELALDLRLLGELYAANGQGEKAIRCFAECATLYARMAEPQREAEAWMCLAETQEQIASGPGAERAWAKMRTAADRAGAVELRMKACEGLARCLKVLNAPEAERFATEGLADAERLGDAAKQATFLNDLGIFAWHRKDYTLARLRYVRALQLLPAEDRVHRAFLMNSLGAVVRALGERDTAAGWFKSALDLARKTGERLVEGHALAQLAEIDLAGGNTASALQRFRASLAIREAIGDLRGEGWMALKVAELLPEDDERKQLLALAEERAIRTGDGELARACAVRPKTKENETWPATSSNATSEKSPEATSKPSPASRPRS